MSEEVLENAENFPISKPEFTIPQIQGKTQKTIESSLKKKDKIRNLSEKELKEINTNREKPGNFEITGVKYLQDNITRNSIVFQIFLSAEKWKGSYEIRKKYTKKLHPNHQTIDDEGIETYNFENIFSIVQLNPYKIYV